MTPLSRDDLEALSAYLDGALPIKERAALDLRLAAEPELRTALDELRLTVRIMRAAPRLVVPRNYTLDPARFARRAPWWTRLDIFRTVGLLGAAASTALIVVGVLLGAFNATPSGAPLTSTRNEVAMQASHTADADAEARDATLDENAVGQSAVAASPTHSATSRPAITSTPVADVVLVSPSPFPSPAASPTPAPLQAGSDSAAASRQADSGAAGGAIAPGALPPSPAEPLTQPTLTALANYAAESFESGAGAPATSESPAVLMGESGPALAAMATATASPPPSRTPPPTITERFDATAPAATTEKAALPPVQMTAGVDESAAATASVSPTPQATRIASAPLPTQEPAPPRIVEALAVESPLPRLLLVAGLGLLLVSAVTWLIGLSRRSRP